MIQDLKEITCDECIRRSKAAPPLFFEGLLLDANTAFDQAKGRGWYIDEDTQLCPLHRITSAMVTTTRRSFSYEIPDSPKSLRETLCVARTLLRQSWSPYRKAHIDLLLRLIAECDRMRPLGPDGKHGDRHTPDCGCEFTS